MGVNFRLMVDTVLGPGRVFDQVVEGSELEKIVSEYVAKVKNRELYHAQITIEPNRTRAYYLPTES
jgi:hypothetical protein